MRMSTTSTILAVGAVVLTSPAAAAQAPAHGSCAAFGGNVASLATTLGPVFGATASGVASSGPAAFPTLVVRPEQAALCGSGQTVTVAPGSAQREAVGQLNQ